jgi:hypothetical protein
MLRTILDRTLIVIGLAVAVTFVAFHVEALINPQPFPY